MNTSWIVAQYLASLPHEQRMPIKEQLQYDSSLHQELHEFISRFAHIIERLSYRDFKAANIRIEILLQYDKPCQDFIWQACHHYLHDQAPGIVKSFVKLNSGSPSDLLLIEHAIEQAREVFKKMQVIHAFEELSGNLPTNEKPMKKHKI